MWGPSWTIFILPLVSVFGTAVVWLANKIRIRPNLPFYVPKERQDAVRPIVKQMNSVVLLVLVAFFTVLEFEILGAAKSPATSLLILPTALVSLAVILALVGIFMTKMYRASR